MVKKQAEVPQAKLIRLLSLINRLKVRRMTRKEISEFLDVGWRTAYRYVKLLEAADIPIEQDFHGRYFIVEPPKPVLPASRPFHWEENNLQNNL